MLHDYKSFCVLSDVQVHNTCKKIWQQILDGYRKKTITLAFALHLQSSCLCFRLLSTIQTILIQRLIGWRLSWSQQQNKSRVTMGTKYAPSHANLYLWGWERELFSSEDLEMYLCHALCWHRNIDDVLVIWTWGITLRRIHQKIVMESL